MPHHLAKVARRADLRPPLLLRERRITATGKGHGRPGELFRGSVETDPEVESDERRQHARELVLDRAPAPFEWATTVVALFFFP